MYSGCDTLSLQTLFVYFLALPSLLHPSILFNYFFILVITWLLTNAYKHTHIDRTPFPAVRTVFDLAAPKTSVSLSFESMILSPLSAPPRSEPKGCRGK